MHKTKFYYYLFQKAISQHQVGFPLSSLVVYKLANLITKCSSSHFMFPILCQQFFFIYLSRIPVNDDDQVYYETYGVADKLYAGDFALMKKLKKSLIEAETYYNSESLNEIDEVKTQFLSSCSKLFKTFLLWLEETQLNKMSHQNIVLPPQFDLQKLSLIFRGNNNHWTEYLCLKDIREAQNHCRNSWLTAIFRYKPYKKEDHQIIIDANENIKERIFKRLKLYSLPKAPPHLLKIKKFMDSVDESKSTLYLLQTEYKILETYAR